MCFESAQIRNAFCAYSSYKVEQQEKITNFLYAHLETTLIRVTWQEML
jgi:hypothetical protein